MTHFPSPTTKKKRKEKKKKGGGMEQANGFWLLNNT